MRMFFTNALNEILGMLIYLQLVVYMPLMSVKFPATALILFGRIIEVVTFSLLPTDDWFPIWFNIPETKAIGCLDDELPCDERFKEFDYSSTNFVINLGSLFLAGNLILFQFLLYYCGKCYEENCLCGRIRNYYKIS